MRWWNRFFGERYDRDYPRGRDRGYERDFRYRSPLDGGWYDRDETRRMARQRFEEEPRRPARVDFRPNEYHREYSNGIGYDPYYNERFPRGESDFDPRDQRPRRYDREFGRPRRRGYDRGY